MKLALKSFVVLLALSLITASTAVAGHFHLDSKKSHTEDSNHSENCVLCKALATFNAITPSFDYTSQILSFEYILPFITELAKSTEISLDLNRSRAPPAQS